MLKLFFYRSLVEAVAQLTAPAKSPATPPCPHCGRPMRQVQTLKPIRGRSPPVAPEVNVLTE
jgi:hypothetical protein